MRDLGLHFFRVSGWFGLGLCCFRMSLGLTQGFTSLGFLVLGLRVLGL